MTKEDRDVILGDNHPDLWNSADPSTMKAHLAKVEAKTKRKDGTLPIYHNEAVRVTRKPCPVRIPRLKRRKGKKRLKAFDVAEICVAKSIETRGDLLALAHEQKGGRED